MSDIARLFQEDPLKLTRPDIDLIIARYREARNQFNLENNKTAGSTKKIAGPKGEKKKVLDLNDLDV